MTRTIVVLPTYDEAENLPLIVPEILAQSGPLLAAVVGATEAVLADDRGAVAAAEAHACLRS